MTNSTATSTLYIYESIPIDAASLLLLIEQCKQQERRAQMHLYQLYAPKIYTTVRRYLVDQSVVNEIVNDTFFKVFTHLDSYASLGSFEAWIRRIAINTIMDFLRKRMKQPTYAPADSATIEIPIPETTISKLAYQELLDLVHALPDMQRAVFNLFVFEDVPHKEIAQMMGITENNSRWHLNDARRRLKEKIDALK